MNQIVKQFSFGDEGREKVFKGIETLTEAVASTLGGGGECVIFEDGQGVPVITKDGVTVAELSVLLDPVENMGASLVKQAARRTVAEAGDGTTTSTVLAHAILKEFDKSKDKFTSREKRDAINTIVDKALANLEKQAKPVNGGMIDEVATISTNNDEELGKLIADAYRAVDLTGVVMMETSQDGNTSIEVVEGVQYEKGFTNNHFVTNHAANTAELVNPKILLVDSAVDTIRQIQTILEHVIKNNIPLLIVGDVDPKVAAALAMNKNKGSIKVNIVPAPTHGVNRKEIFDDLALLTGATVISENLGDDLDLIDLSCLGTCIKAVSTFKDTVFQIDEEQSEEVQAIISNIKEQLLTESNSSKVIKLEKRLAMLAAKLAIVKVGGNSDVELNEKKDRVEDAICATKAAIKEGVVAGGGVALINAATSIKAKTPGEELVLKALYYPCKTIMKNAGLKYKDIDKKNYGVNVENGKTVNMFRAGIIDPVLVTKSALKNAASVASTILSTNCVMSNVRG
jgi:chaperonin GroEL